MPRTVLQPEGIQSSMWDVSRFTKLLRIIIAYLVLCVEPIMKIMSTEDINGYVNCVCLVAFFRCVFEFLRNVTRGSIKSQRSSTK